MKYNRSEIMKKAWELIRSTGKTLREALKDAWRMAKINLLVKAGARRWTKGDMDRLYINADVLGYVWETYKTGNVSWAELNGSHISNSEMSRVLAAKTYIDCKTLKLFGSYRDLTDEVSDWMHAVIG